jgi:hypothetical protein
MGDELAPAVAVLQRKLDDQLKAVTETKKLINMLLKSMGQPEQYSDTGESSGIIRPDQFYGKQFATAATEYLETRKQACQPDDILRGLAEGGFDFDVMGWKESDRLRSLAISLAKNNVKFHRLKNGSFGLRAWYDDEFLKKAASRKAVVRAEGMNETAEVSTEMDAVYVPKIGDYVQWEIKGVLQLPEARQIIKLSEDGTFAFVEGSNGTGVPVEELILEPKPTTAKGSAKTKGHPAADRTA